MFNVTQEKIKKVGFRFFLKLRMVPTNSKVFLPGSLDRWEKQILTSVVEIQKENWG